MLKLLFPALTNNRAPISYELGVAILLAWVGESIYRIKDVISRYPSNFWLWKFIDDNDIEVFFPWYCITAAILICIGLFQVAYGIGRGHIFRATGLFMGGLLFLLIAMGHLTITFYSIGGAPYLFLAWRFIELSLFYIHKS